MGASGQNNWDKDFHNILRETLINEYLLDSKPPNSDRRPQIIKSKHLRNFIYRFDRVFLRWLSSLHRMNLLAPYEAHSKRLTTRQKVRRLFNSKNATDERWPKIFQVIFLLLVSLFLFQIYHQYQHDFSLVQLRYLESHLNNPDSSFRSPDYKLLKSKLLERSRQERTILKLLGASHIQWTLKSQSSRIFILTFNLILLVLFPMLTHLNNITSISPRVILDRRNECQLRAQLILREIDRLVESNINFGMAKMDRALHELTLLARKSSTAGDNYHDSNNLDQLQHRLRLIITGKIDQQHQLTIDLLKRIAMEGRLNQLNRSPASQDLLALVVFTCISLIPLATTFILAYVYYLMKIFLDTKGEHLEFESFRDVLEFLLIFLVIIVLTNLTSAYMATIIATTLVDQLSTLNQLKALILTAIKTNKARIKQQMILCALDRRSYDGASYRIMPQSHQLSFLIPHKEALRTSSLSFEMDTLTIIIQCRLFVCGYKLVRRQMSLFAGFYLFFSIFLAFLLRLQSPYNYAELKRIDLIVGSTGTVACFCFLIPIAMLHQRSQKTFETLWSLVAQISQLEQGSRLISKGSPTEWSLATFTLRREMANLNTSHFACKVYMMPIAYGNLIKIAFWLVLILIQLSESSLPNSLVGFSGFMSDPFGLFKIHPTNRSI